MTMIKWVRMRLTRDQPSKVRHVDQEESPDFISNCTELRKINLARISRPTGNDQFRFVLSSQCLNLIKVDQMIIFTHAVLDRIEPLSRLVRTRAMRQVTASIEAHAEDCIARLQQSLEDRLVCLRT
eukprot:CAMPEP_0184468754 /NCGR_PEP_ID=MMETSP0740-20130409/81131_1 /TAXON_ID=385413 /ORGANISM="Thalassiosira miniscula, Strain CCMP1093" /LENGTH=125 /DNA_ID=CAMNT_0026844447 /DNA_START=172 /DNA_END=549 /DNA_ORIENTATION=+